MAPRRQVTCAWDATITRARQGDGAAWSAVFNELAPKIAAYLRMHGVGDVDDVASEVFLGVIRNINSFEGAWDDFRSWVFVIAHRRVQDAWRRDRARPPAGALRSDTSAPGGDVEQLAMIAFDTTRVEQLCGQLSADQRAVLLLRIIGDFNVGQIAAMVHKTPEAVKSLQRRGLAGIRAILEREGVTA